MYIITTGNIKKKFCNSVLRQENCTILYFLIAKCADCQNVFKLQTFQQIQNKLNLSNIWSNILIIGLYSSITIKMFEAYCKSLFYSWAAIPWFAQNALFCGFLNLWKVSLNWIHHINDNIVFCWILIFRGFSKRQNPGKVAHLINHNTFTVPHM